MINTKMHRCIIFLIPAIYGRTHSWCFSSNARCSVWIFCVCKYFLERFIFDNR